MRIGASLVVALAAALCAVGGATPAQQPTVLGVLVGDRTSTLTWLDAASLEPTGAPTLALRPTLGRGPRSPDGSLVAFAANDAPDLIVVDVRRMAMAATFAAAKAGTIQPIAWPEEHRLYAYAWGCCPARTDVIVVDPLESNVVARIAVAGSPLSEAPTTSGVAILTAPAKGIGMARLLLVSRDGTARRAALARIRAGSRWKTVHTQPAGTIRHPGFTVDAAGGTGYVVDPGGLVARIDLATLAVSYHGSRTFARADKQVSGPILSARWIGDGCIAVTGTNAQLRKTRSGWKQSWAPAGLRLLDTGSWTSRVADPDASWFVQAADELLVVAKGSLTSFGHDGTVRWRIPAGSQAFVEAYGDYAYVWTETTVTVVRAATGAVVGRLARPSLWLVAAG